MTSQGEAVQTVDESALSELRGRIDQFVGGQVRNLEIVRRHQGVILRGLAPSYYLKQVVQHLVMNATELPILNNDIQVQRPPQPNRY